MAIICLFRPYNAWYVPYTRWQIPCTPGIFPRRRSTLAEAVASTITDTLLTTADIKIQADSLVTEENIYLAIDAAVDTILRDFRDTAKLHRLAGDIAELSPTLLEHLIESIIEATESGNDERLGKVTEKIFDQVILSARISLDQADEIAGRIMDNILTTERIRTGLISLLSPQNINSLDESIHAHASGPYRMLARVIGVKRVLYEWRNFLEKEPKEAHRIISDLIKRFGIRDQIALQIANLDLRAMPLQNIAKLRENLVNFIQTFVTEHKRDILASVQRIEVEAMGTVRSAIIGFNPESIPEEWLKRAKHDLSGFCHQYLERELGELLEKAIPAMGIHGLIARKIEEFSPRQLETVVQRICKKELGLLEWAGAIIGGWLGFVQIGVNLWFHVH